MLERRRPWRTTACALILFATLFPAAETARALASPSCEEAAFAYLALVVQRTADRRRYLRCLAERRQDCRAEFEQLRSTEEQLRLLGTYLRGCTR